MCWGETKCLALSQELCNYNISEKRRKSELTPTAWPCNTAFDFPRALRSARARARVCVCVCVWGFCRYPSNGASFDLVSEWRFLSVISPVITMGIPHTLLQMLLAVSPYLIATVTTVSPYFIANVANGFSIPYWNCHYSFPILYCKCC